jgi:hypothetical protein
MASLFMPVIKIRKEQICLTIYPAPKRGRNH